VLVVDNGSDDGSAAMVQGEYPWVELIANEANEYYAHATNQALLAAEAPLRMLLNSDIEAPPGAMAGLVEWMEGRQRVGALAPRLVHPDGRLQRSCRSFPAPDVVVYECLGLSRLFPGSRVFGKYRMTWWDYGEDRAVDQPMASALVLRAEALAQVGLLDEDFPMFFNDVDLCQRLWAAGWEVWYTPSVALAHHHGASTRMVRGEMVAESGRSFLRYYRKHYRGRCHWASYGLAVSLLRAAYAWRRAWSAIGSFRRARGSGGLRP